MELDTDVMADDDEVREAIDTLAGRFAAWAQALPSDEVDPGHVELFLEWKAFRADGHLGRWVRDDVDELLLEELPRRLAASSEQVQTLPATLAAFVRMLDEDGLLAPGSDDATRLGQRALAQARGFLDAMDDPAMFGMGKRLTSAMGLTGDEDLTQEDLDTLIERFNALDAEERHAIIDGGQRPGPPVEPEPTMALPYRHLPGDDELDALADGVVLLDRVDRLVAALPPGGAALTKAGWLKLADGRRLVAEVGLPDPADRVRSTADLPGLFSVVQVGLTAGALRLGAARLTPEPGWSDLRAGQRWAAVAGAMVATGAASVHFGAREPSPLALAEVADGVTIVFLTMLWLAEEPLPSTTFADAIEAAFDDGLVDDDIVLAHPDVARSSIPRRATDVLESLDDAGLIDRVEDTVALRRGGDRVIAPILAQAGFEATTTDDVVALDADGLLDLLAETYGAELGTDIAMAWFDAGEGREAELLAAAVARPDPVNIMATVSLLADRGDAGHDALRAAEGTPLAPFAQVALAEHEGLDPGGLPPEMMTEISVVTLLAMIDVGSAADVVEAVLELVPPGAATSFLDSMLGSDHPRTVEVFDQIGRHHPDKRVAKHARKLAHRWRSAHGTRR